MVQRSRRGSRKINSRHKTRVIHITHPENLHAPSNTARQARNLGISARTLRGIRRHVRGQFSRRRRHPRATMRRPRPATLLGIPVPAAIMSSLRRLSPIRESSPASASSNRNPPRSWFTRA
jgi:inner membrane protein involved in colicin E2 resistance